MQRSLHFLRLGKKSIMSYTKPVFITLIALAISGISFGQSESYRLLKDKFAGRHHKVVSFRASGFLTRTIFAIAGEHDVHDAIRDVRKIRLIVIPKEAFRSEHVTLAGFRKVASDDNFHELMYIRDGKDHVTVLMQPGRKEKDNHYLLLVESDDEVVAIEIRGYLDPEQLKMSLS